MRILLAEDDRMLNRALCYQLENLDFQVDSCLDGEDALFYGEQNIYDVILLDRMLPGMEGTEILTALRAKGISTPIIMITALGTLSDKVKGLDLGADDYLVKPFAFEELSARIRSIGRRNKTYDDAHRLSYGDITYDTQLRELNGPTGSLQLSGREGRLLEVLLQSPDTVIHRPILFSKVWGTDAPVEESNLDTYVHFVRKRLKQTGSALSLLTIRGSGYKLSQ